MGGPKTVCVVDGCDNEVLVQFRGLCRKHYRRWQRHGDPAVVTYDRSPLTLGSRFGRLTIIAEAGSNSHNKRLYECECDCGNKTIAIRSKLVSGHTQSCGCLHSERTSASNRELHRVHGHKANGIETREYKTWRGMMDRCGNQNCPAWPYYGGRGIYICEGWFSFTNFFADMGSKPNGLSIDRVDNDGGYWCGHCDQCVEENLPANCRWATPEEQANNRRPMYSCK